MKEGVMKFGDLSNGNKFIQPCLEDRKYPAQVCIKVHGVCFAVDDVSSLGQIVDALPLCRAVDLQTGELVAIGDEDEVVRIIL